MIVCSCEAVSDREIRQHIKRGCGSVRRLGEVSGAGTDCGSCCRDLKAMIDQSPKVKATFKLDLPLIAK